LKQADRQLERQDLGIIFSFCILCTNDA